MADRKLDALSKVPLFSHASQRELEFVASRTDEVEIAAGQQLIQQGKPTDTFFVLLEGEVEIDRDGKPLSVMHAGDFFGEISMLDGGPATATAVTKTPARFMVMSHSQFRDAIKGNDDLLIQVLASVAARLRSLELVRSAGR